jgi:hypothetical protein
MWKCVEDLLSYLSFWGSNEISDSAVAFENVFYIPESGWIRNFIDDDDDDDSLWFSYIFRYSVCYIYL